MKTPAGNPGATPHYAPAKPTSNTSATPRLYSCAGQTSELFRVSASRFLIAKMPTRPTQNPAFAPSAAHHSIFATVPLSSPALSAFFIAAASNLFFPRHLYTRHRRITIFCCPCLPMLSHLCIHQASLNGTAAQFATTTSLKFLLSHLTSHTSKF